MSRTTASTPIRDLMLYWVLACALSWPISVPLALTWQRIIPPTLPPWGEYLAGCGPFLAAVIVAWTTQKSAGLRELGRRALMWRVPPILWLAAFLPFLIEVGVVLILNILLGRFGAYFIGPNRIRDMFSFIVLLLGILLSGLSGEIGWRGYLLPRLQQRHDAFSATVLLTILWLIWQLPQFFSGWYTLEITPRWMFVLFADAILLTWLFNSTGGSVLLTSIFQSCFYFLSASGDTTLKAFVGVIMIIWAFVVVVWRKPTNLSAHLRITA